MEHQQPARSQHELWKLLDALAICRAQYKLTANSLSVLRALISFLPKSATPHEPMLVWPSNHSLCERADGMDERTLRRHIERLVKAGLISRRSSSNGKRFALRHKKTIVNAFGFDLSPMNDRSEEIVTRAQNERDEAQQCRNLRCEILRLLHEISQSPELLNPEEEACIRRTLRRKVDMIVLSEIHKNLTRSHHNSDIEPTNLTAKDSQSDRHQQKTEKDYYESVCSKLPIGVTKDEKLGDIKEKYAKRDKDLTIEDCLDATTESRTFAQEPVRTWADMIRLADTLAPMIGIDPELRDHSKRAMGPLKAAISVLCIIQRSAHIKRPAAYLRKLAILAETNEYSLSSLVSSALRTKFTAANHILT